MRIDAKLDNLTERIGLLANQVPVPVGQANFRSLPGLALLLAEAV